MKKPSYSVFHTIKLMDLGMCMWMCVCVFECVRVCTYTDSYMLFLESFKWKFSLKRNLYKWKINMAVFYINFVFPSYYFSALTKLNLHSLRLSQQAEKNNVYWLPVLLSYLQTANKHACLRMVKTEWFINIYFVIDDIFNVYIWLNLFHKYTHRHKYTPTGIIHV